MSMEGPRPRTRTLPFPPAATPEPQDPELREVVDRLRRATERLTAVTGKAERPPTGTRRPGK